MGSIPTRLVMWETDLLRDLANKIEEQNREVASKLNVIAINYEDLKRESAENAVRIDNQISLIWDLRRRIRELNGN